MKGCLPDLLATAAFVIALLVLGTIGVNILERLS